MTDTITPASLRAHADWLLATHGDSERLAGQLRSAANKLEIRLEAESARDEEDRGFARHWWRMYVDGYCTIRPERRDRFCPWDEIEPSAIRVGHLAAARSLRETAEWLIAEAVHQERDRLAADGRLLPEGGTVLTAEQWAMVRTLIEASHREPEVQRAADRLRVEFKVGRCRCGGLIAEPSPGCEWHSAREVTPPAVSVPDSGPDGTPEKPWPTWQDVPEGVVYRGARDTSGWDGWFNRSGTRRRFFDGALSKNSEAMIADEAPFVRVDGGKA